MITCHVNEFQENERCLCNKRRLQSVCNLAERMSFKKAKNEKRASSRGDFEEIGIQLGDMAAPGKITILIFIPHYKAKEAVQP